MLGTIAPGPIVLMGASLGAAVALQQAAQDRRVNAVVAAETFSDLRTDHRAGFLIHGDADLETPPDHSRRVFAALGGPKRLLLVRGAAHNGSLRTEVWDEIERWIDGVIPPRQARGRERSGVTYNRD